MALVSMALFYYVRHLREPSAVWTRIAGFLFAILAFMIRQPAILLIFTFEVLQIWKYRRNWKKTTGSVGFMLAALGIYILVDRVLMNYLEVGQQYQSVVQVYFSVLTDYPIDFIYRQVKYNVYTVIMSGFYLSPLLMSLYALLKGKGVANKHLTIWLGTAFILALLIWFAGHTFPYNGSIFKNFTLGVSLLLDWTWWPNQTLPSLSDWVWIPVSVVSIFCSGLIFYSLWQSRTRSVIQWMLMLVVSYQLLMTIFSFTDRYFIWTLFVLLVALATIPMPRVSWAFYIPLLLLMYLSIAGTKDYLEWNRLVKERYSALVEQGISPQKIDAGMPINSHFSDIHPWTPNATHVFSFTKVDNRQIRDSISFFRYLSLEQDQIYILSGEQ